MREESCCLLADQRAWGKIECWLLHRLASSYILASSGDDETSTRHYSYFTLLQCAVLLEGFRQIRQCFVHGESTCTGILYCRACSRQYCSCIEEITLLRMKGLRYAHDVLYVNGPRRHRFLPPLAPARGENFAVMRLLSKILTRRSRKVKFHSFFERPTNHHSKNPLASNSSFHPSPTIPPCLAASSFTRPDGAAAPVLLMSLQCITATELIPRNPSGLQYSLIPHRYRLPAGPAPQEFTGHFYFLSRGQQQQSCRQEWQIQGK